MPQQFLDCAAQGGMVRTKSLSGGHYMKLCKKPGGGWVAGHVETKKTRPKMSRSMVVGPGGSGKRRK